MNAATAVRPEVTAFVVRVREHLGDLTEEEQEELVGGLEADLSEQAAEGTLVLPDPAQYAVELRAAAGLPAARRTALPTFGAVRRIAEWPVAARARWFGLTERNGATRQAWAVLLAMRPAWWVLRAWIAVTLLDQAAGTSEDITVVPTLAEPIVGPLVLAAAVVVSLLVGLGRLWPGVGPDRHALARLVLVALNAVAILAPLSFSLPSQHQEVHVTRSGYNPGYYAGFHDGSRRPGLRNGIDVVRNIYAYDAAGQPLVGVQLFDQKGRPVAVAPESSMREGKERSVTCPWLNGTATLFNVFPLQERLQRSGTCLDDVDPAKVGVPGFHEPPLASVPPATLPNGTAP